MNTFEYNDSKATFITVNVTFKSFHFIKSYLMIPYAKCVFERQIGPFLQFAIVSCRLNTNIEGKVSSFVVKESNFVSYVQFVHDRRLMCRNELYSKRFQ